MKRNYQNVALGVLLGIAVLAVLVVVDRWNASTYADMYAEKISQLKVVSPAAPGAKNIADLEVPRDAAIFGERLPLENWDIRERFEREFYSNWNSASNLLIWWQRSGRYFARIEQMLREAGLPADLEYLAVAESGLSNVKSPANALGFWQFIPQTAKRFGLRVDDAIDERLDPEKSTRAAIAYFKYIKSMLPSWTLVAAGYNMGEDNVTQAMQWQHATRYWDLYLNDETMRYVFRIAAIKELMLHSAKYGLDFSHLNPYRSPQVRRVTVRGPITSIADWAFEQGYLYKDVKVLNPWLIGRSIPNGSYEIALPSTDNDRASIK